MLPRLVTFRTRFARFLWSRTGAALVLLTLCAIAGFVMLQHRDEPEPSYQSISASEWLERCTTNWNKMPEVTDAFIQMGPAGVEYLGRELIHQPSKWDEWLLSHHQNIPTPLRKKLFKPRQQLTSQALQALLLKLGTNAAPAMPMLLTWLETNNTVAYHRAAVPISVFSPTNSTVQGIQIIGTNAILPGYMFKRTGPSNQYQIVSSGFGGSLLVQTQVLATAPGMVSTNLIISSRYASNTIPTDVYFTLRNVGSTDPRIIPLLFRAIPGPAMIGMTHEYGTNLKVAASQCIPLLVKKAASPDRVEKSIALGLLKLTLPESATARDVFIQALNDNDYPIFDFVLHSLTPFTNEVDRIVPLALDGIRRRPKMFESNRILHSRTPYPDFWDEPYTPLKEFARYSPKVIPGLQDILRDSSDRPDYYIIRFLAEIGSTNDIDLNLIRSFTNSMSVETRSSAWNLIGKLTGDTNAFVMEQLAYMHPGTVLTCYERLGAMGPAARIAVPKIREGLQHSEERIVAKAAETLGRIGPVAKDTLPDLEALRDHARLSVREAVEDAIHKISAPPKAKGAE